MNIRTNLYYVKECKESLLGGWFFGIILLHLLGTFILGFMAFAAALGSSFGGSRGGHHWIGADSMDLGHRTDGCLVFWPYWRWTARNYNLMGVRVRNNRRLRDAKDYRTR